MAKKFNIAINADNTAALKSMRAISVEMYKINEGFRRAKKGAAGPGGGPLDPKSLNVIGSELKNVNAIFKTMAGSKNRWERDAGFTQLKNAFKGTAEAAGDLKAKVSGILGPVLALTGIGSLAGIANIAAGWGDAAKNIKLTNYETDLGQAKIQSWINMGQAFGITTEDMTAGIKGFAKSMEDISFGRNNSMMAFLSRPDIGIKNIRSRVLTPEGIDGIMRELSEKLQKFTPIARSQMLDKAQLGFMKPMLMYGGSEYDKRKKMSEQLGYVATDDQLARTRDYNRAMDGLNLSLSTFQHKMSDQIIPTLQPIAEGFSKWIVQTDNVKVAVDALAVVIGVTLVGAIAALGVAILATPIGWFAALGAAGVVLYEKWKPFHDLMKDMAGTAFDHHDANILDKEKAKVNKNRGTWAIGAGGKQVYYPTQLETPAIGVGGKEVFYPKPRTSIPKNVGLIGPPVASAAGGSGVAANDILNNAALAVAQRAVQPAPQQHQITVDFKNAPPGTKVTTNPAPGTSMPTNINYSMPSFP